MLAGGGWLSPRDNRDWDIYSRVAERPARTAPPEPLAALGSPPFPDFALPFCPLGSPPSLPVCYRLRLPGAHLLSQGPGCRALHLNGRPGSMGMAFRANGRERWGHRVQDVRRLNSGGQGSPLRPGPTHCQVTARVASLGPDCDCGRGGLGPEGARVPAKAGGQAGSPAEAGTSWSGSQLDLNFSLCVQRPSDLLLQQCVGPLQGLVLHGQLAEPQLCLLLGHALERRTETPVSHASARGPGTEALTPGVNGRAGCSGEPVRPAAGARDSAGAPCLPGGPDPAPWVLVPTRCWVVQTPPLRGWERSIPLCRGDPVQ